MPQSCIINICDCHSSDNNNNAFLYVNELDMHIESAQQQQSDAGQSEIDHSSQGCCDLWLSKANVTCM